MIGLKRYPIQLPIRLYVALSLGAAAILSPPTFSTVPLLFLALFLYFRFRPPRPVVNLSLDLYLFLALPLIYESSIAPELSPLLSLPLLALLDSDLQQLASAHDFRDSRFKRWPSQPFVGLALAVVVSLAISAFLGKTSLIIACALLACYLLFLLARVVMGMPPQPIEASKRQHRVVAGQSTSFTVPLSSSSKLAGWLYLAAPYEWVKLRPTRSPLAQGTADLQVTLTPPLAGPSSVCLTGFVLDRWGLIQHKFQLELAELYVIPRASYALWLARRYLETTRAGAIIPMASTPSAFRPAAGSRRGTEYYGNRLYQPGDSLRSIDWKRSLKFNEIVVKEFDDPRAAAAALLVNLTVGNAEECDRLTYTWITTSITLAREGIPTMLAVYNHEDVLTVTDLLSPRQMVLASLELSRQVAVWASPQKYLQPPDPLRIRANLSRLRTLGLDSVTKLVELLDLEFKALCDYVASNPATIALSRALGKATSRPTVLFLSAGNHDEEAVRMAKYNLKVGNHSFAEISLDQPVAHPGRGRGQRLGVA